MSRRKPSTTERIDHETSIPLASYPGSQRKDSFRLTWLVAPATLLLLGLSLLRYIRVGYVFRLRRSIWLGFPTAFKWGSGAVLWRTDIDLLFTVRGTNFGRSESATLWFRLEKLQTHQNPLLGQPRLLLGDSFKNRATILVV
eukprot:5207855-Pyramimonas_sp.AAC.1